MITLEAHGYRVTLDPAQGAQLDRLEWLHPARGWLALLEPRQAQDPARGPTQAGCFIMAPFANRIAAGRFRFDGIDHAIAVNLPQEDMAIHGSVRDKSWRLLAADQSQARLALDPCHEGECHEGACHHGPWHFSMELLVTLDAQGVTLEVQLTNLGRTTMPFGMGLHPWFPKTAGSTLAFASPHLLRRDPQGLPLAQTEACPAFDPAAPQDLNQIAWVDGFCPDWPQRHARIVTPDVEIDLRAEGALRYLHVYVPDNLPVFCAEPVSHAPDAINRPAVPQMDLLAPHESLRGRMTLSAGPAAGLAPVLSAAPAAVPTAAPIKARAFLSAQEVSDDPQNL